MHALTEDEGDTSPFELFNQTEYNAVIKCRSIHFKRPQKITEIMTLIRNHLICSTPEIIANPN